MAEDSRAIQPYEIIEYEGKEARKYPNGVIRSPKGYIVFMPPEIARGMERQRKVSGEERAREGIKLATQSESPEEAVMKIIRARALVAMTDNGRAGNDAAKLVLVASGFLTPERKVEVNGEIRHNAVLPEFPPKYLERIKQIADRDVIEGRVIDDKQST